MSRESAYPAASPYQVMPPLAEPEYEALKASVAAGYDPARPIVVDERGAVLDGHHRQQACAELGITPPSVVLPGLTEEQKHDYAMRANLACRHLTQLQKRDLIRAELERDPGRSNREIGRLCGADHKTVAAVRQNGEFPQTGRWQRGASRSAGEKLAENAAAVLALDDETAAKRAEAMECYAHWREAWPRIVEALAALATAWGAELAEHTGYATCWEWLQGDHGDQWEFIARNVGPLQDLDEFMAWWFAAEAPLMPLLAGVPTLLGPAETS